MAINKFQEQSLNSVWTYICRDKLLLLDSYMWQPPKLKQERFEKFNSHDKERKFTPCTTNVVYLY